MKIMIGRRRTEGRIGKKEDDDRRKEGRRWLKNQRKDGLQDGGGDIWH